MAPGTGFTCFSFVIQDNLKQSQCNRTDLDQCQRREAMTSNLPLTHVTELYRGFLRGHVHPSMAIDLVWLVVAAAVAYWSAVVSMRRRLICRSRIAALISPSHTTC